MAMANLIKDPGELIRRSYHQLSRIPGGKRIFSKMIGMAAPYTGTIDAEVVDLDVGRSEIRMRDRRAVRNHLSSVHAIALLNLAEVATGLAMMFSLPPHARGILSGLSIEYIKKARGTLTAISNCPVPPDNGKREYDVPGEIYNEHGELVARATARWLIGPT